MQLPGSVVVDGTVGPSQLAKENTEPVLFPRRRMEAELELEAAFVPSVAVAVVSELWASPFAAAA